MLADEGLIDYQAPVSHYLPEIAHTRYAKASIRDLIDMRAGVVLDESEQRAYDLATNWEAAQATPKTAAMRQRTRPARAWVIAPTALVTPMPLFADNVTALAAMFGTGVPEGLSFPSTTSAPVTSCRAGTVNPPGVEAVVRSIWEVRNMPLEAAASLRPMIRVPALMRSPRNTGAPRDWIPNSSRASRSSSASTSRRPNASH